MKPFLLFLSCLSIAYGHIYFGNSLQVKSRNELEAAKYYYWTASTRTAQEMYASIPWEAKIEAKNNLLLAVCKKQKTKLCKEIQDGFNNSGKIAEWKKCRKGKC